jgi:hypothetical protein
MFRLGQNDAWVRWFADAVIGAGQARRDLIGAVEALEVQWRRRLAGSRSGGRDGIEGHAGRRVRRDALAWKVLDLLPGHLVLCAAAVATELGASLRASKGALNELVDVGILALYEPTGRRSPGRPALLYVSPELLGVAGEIVGADHVFQMPHPVMGAEDFSYVLEAVPGSMMFLGGTHSDRNPATAPPNHSNRVTFDEQAMAAGMAIYSAVAIRHLEQADATVG